MAIGSDAQWSRITKTALFASLDKDHYATNEGRRKDKVKLHQAIEAITQKYPSAKVAEVLTRAEIPHSPITPIEEVPDLPFVASTALRAITPDGRIVRLPPPAVSTNYLKQIKGILPFAPAYGEHTDNILKEVGLSPAEIASLRERKIVA